MQGVVSEGFFFCFCFKPVIFFVLRGKLKHQLILVLPVSVFQHFSPSGKTVVLQINWQVVFTFLNKSETIVVGDSSNPDNPIFSAPPVFPFCRSVCSCQESVRVSFHVNGIPRSCIIKETDGVL